MIFLVPYAYDRMPGGKPRKGVPLNRLGSKARCDALAKIAENIDQYKSYWVLTAGYSKKSPTQSSSLNKESLADQMYWYIKSLGFREISSWPRSWGTHKETTETVKIIINMALPPPHLRLNPPVDVYISTNLGHMPRVWLCWFFLKPKGWKVHFVPANHSFTLKEYFQETAKFFVYLYHFLSKKW